MSVRTRIRSVWGVLAAMLLVGGCGRHQERVLLIGLDAANWGSMEELMAAGDLPNLSRLVRSGAAGSLATFVPTASPALWTTMATGYPPDRHGISFRVLGLDEQGEHEMLAALSSDERKVPALWNHCTDAGIRSAFVGWWATCPAETVGGFMVSDRVWDASTPRTTFPESLKAELVRQGIFDGAIPPAQERLIRDVERRFRAWRQAVEEGAVAWEGGAPDVQKYFDDLEERIRVYRRIMALDYATERITLALVDRDPSLRVIAPYFWYLDVCQHLLWKYWRPEGFAVDPQEVRIFGELVPEYYRFVDGVVGRLLERVEPTAVIVVSDHGMESSTAERCINDLFDVARLLEDAGWLVRAPDGTADMARSRAYVHAESRQLRLINVSLAGREPGGCVSPRDHDAVVESLAAELGGLRCTPSGEPVFKDVRALTKGAHSYRAGDFVVYVFGEGDLAAAINLRAPLSDSLSLGAMRFPLTRWNRWQPGASGQHSEGPPGIVILQGSPFARGVRLHGARLYDVAPTVLAVLGLPLAQDLAGAPLVDAFSPRFLKSHPPSYVASYGVRATPRTHEDRDGGGDAALLDQLRALGYIR